MVGCTSSITRLIAVMVVATLADVGVDQISVEQTSAEDLGRTLGLDCAGRRLPALLTPAQREDRDLVSSGDVAGQNAAATDLDVVGVSADREHHLEAFARRT